MPDFASVILRFRDLSTPAGTTTVEQHKRIITEKGYVWWGWWHKQGETVPENAFREILVKIRQSGPYQIFLFDSGKYTVQRAWLLDIRWDAKLTPIPTPERDATPGYYGDSHYLAWFKLKDIEDILLPPTELLNWSYVQI